MINDPQLSITLEQFLQSDDDDDDDELVHLFSINSGSVWSLLSELWALGTGTGNAVPAASIKVERIKSNEEEGK